MKNDFLIMILRMMLKSDSRRQYLQSIYGIKCRKPLKLTPKYIVKYNNAINITNDFFHISAQDKLLINNIGIFYWYNVDIGIAFPNLFDMQRNLIS